jgi:hypothetical protein
LLLPIPFVGWPPTTNCSFFLSEPQYLVKALMKQTVQPLTSVDVKEVEAAVGTERVSKTKEEQAAIAAKSKAPRNQLNTGMAKGKSAGLDEYIYDDAGDGDDDFM